LDSIIDRCRVVGATHIIVYYSFLPELPNRLKKEIPEAKVYVRTVNAEAFQHWQRSEIGFIPNYKNLRSIYGAVRLAWRDTLCKRNAEGLLGISEWDNKHYWGRLPGKAIVHDVPYHCPWPIIRSQVKPTDWSDRQNQFVCLAGGRDAIGRAMVEGFNQLADALGDTPEFRDWKFLLSPGILHRNVDDVLSPRVERMTSLEEPWDLLCSVRVLAVLTPLGFGCKTSIIDALTAGCQVLVHPVLAKRLPVTVRARCIELSPGKGVPAKLLAGMLQQEPDSRGVDQALRTQAMDGIQRALDVPESPSLDEVRFD
jgi:hypothetical protein